MNTKFNFAPEDQTERLAYIRAVDAGELPDDVKAQLGEIKQLYALHASDGERLALVKDREMAFILARQNDLAPVTVH